MNKNISISALLFACILLVVGCSDEVVSPVFNTDGEFEAPIILNGTSTEVPEFTADNGGEPFETFQWETSDYGAQVSVKYVIEAAKTDEFATTSLVKEVHGSGEGETKSVVILNKDINSAMLSLGLTAGEEGTINIRIYSFINGLNTDTLYSNVIVRSAIPFRSSDCGNFCTVGVIGSATPGGWDTDTDMHLSDVTGVDKSTWTVTMYLKAGDLKFRAQDSWDVNWGANTFPSGTGTQGGDNVPIAEAGYYKITLNDQTGAYSLAAAGASTFTSMGLIGAQSSWSSDIGDLTKSGTDPHVWTGSIALEAGELKFRANDSWDNNWGVASFPSGYGIGGGANIAIPVSGTYFVYFNDASGEFFFGPTANATPYDAVGVIGSATPGGWDADTDLVKNPANPFKWSGKMTINDGDAKFRANNGWDVNWGASGFPKGTGVQNGANIPVQAGTYFISFNTATGEYYFLK